MLQSIVCKVSGCVAKEILMQNDSRLSDTETPTESFIIFYILSIFLSGHVEFKGSCKNF